VEERPLSSFYEPDSSTSSSFLIFVHPPSKPMATYVTQIGRHLLRPQGLTPRLQWERTV
jgi:hypothetical protein